MTQVLEYKNAEILALRRQLVVLQRQLGADRVRLTRATEPCSRRCCTICPDAYSDAFI